ncbi:MAG: TetR/AcrR family transcriptional regulator [Proteobacteria bacterium]|nr:TetR/AcrR family transcriptional regulator [Pseudomonadota bacterium]
MARRVSKEADERRTEIMNVAQGLFMTKGYDSTSVQQIIEAVGIAKGTFYHHFKSKVALLDAIAVALSEQGMAVMQVTADEPGLSASERINKFFETINAWKVARKDLLIAMIRPLLAPSNAAFRDRLERQNVASITPLLARIIQEGVDEGTFDVFDATEAAGVILAISRMTGLRLQDLLLADATPDQLGQAESMVLANQQAVARVLGTKPGVVHLISIDAVRAWFE